jgi:hypothetical protein
MFFIDTIFRWVLLLICAGLTAGCATQPNGSVRADALHLPSPQAFRTWTPAQQLTWLAVSFPGKKPTQYQLAQRQGREGVQADAQSALSMLRQSVYVPADQLGALKFSWYVPELITGADMGVREADDSPVRLVLAFEGDRSKFSARNAMLNELVRSLTHEEMPYATLMYVWCNHRPVESVIVNPRTDRIQKIVVESGPHQLQRWLDYERDIRADFEKAFGEAPGPLVAIGLMTDSDNTRTNTRAWYGDVQLLQSSTIP